MSRNLGGRSKSPVEYTALRCYRHIYENCVLSDPPEGGKRMVEELSGLTYNTFIVELVKKWACDSQVFIWRRCPKGIEHTSSLLFVGTIGEFKSGECFSCDAIASNISYGSAFKGLEKFVIREEDLALALSHRSIQTKCSNCSTEGTHPLRRGSPLCSTCVVTDGYCIGALVKRPLDGVTCGDIFIDSLISLFRNGGMTALADVGIIVPTCELKSKYANYPVIKPSIVLCDYNLCIDIYEFDASSTDREDGLLEIDTVPTSMHVNDSKYMAKRAASLNGIGWNYLVFSRYDLDKLEGIENMVYKTFFYSSEAKFPSFVYDEVVGFIKNNKIVKNKSIFSNVHKIHENLLQEEEIIMSKLELYVEENLFNDVTNLFKRKLKYLQSEKIRYHGLTNNGN